MESENKGNAEESRSMRDRCQGSVPGSSHTWQLFRTFNQLIYFTSWLSSSWSWSFCHLSKRKNTRKIFISTEGMYSTLGKKESWDFNLDSILSYHFSQVSISLSVKWIWFNNFYGVPLTLCAMLSLIQICLLRPHKLKMSLAAQLHFAPVFLIYPWAENLILAEIQYRDS